MIVWCGTCDTETVDMCSTPLSHGIGRPNCGSCIQLLGYPQRVIIGVPMTEEEWYNAFAITAEHDRMRHYLMQQPW